MIRSEKPLWGGDNPYIRLFEDASSGPSSVGSFFRVQYSPAGSGHVALLSTGLATSQPDVYCLTDNEALAQFLVTSIVHRFTGFDGVINAQDPPITVARFETAPGSNGVVERAAASDVEIEYAWLDLGDPFYVEFVHPKLPYRLFSLFVPAAEATLTLNGRRLDGTVAPDKVEGKSVTSACLALAESWVSDQETA